MNNHEMAFFGLRQADAAVDGLDEVGYAIPPIERGY